MDSNIGNHPVTFRQPVANSREITCGQKEGWWAASRGSRMRPVAEILAVLWMVFGCGGSDDDKPRYAGYQSADSDYQGFFLATVPSDYSSSNLIFNDFSTGELQTVLTGESGDPFLTYGDQSVWYFNRSVGDINYRRITLNAAAADTGDRPSEGSSKEVESPSRPWSTEIKATVQLSTPETSAGDPAATLDLGDGRLLLGHKSAGKITVLNSESGEHITTIAADFSLPSGSPLRPTDFLLRTDDEQGEISVYVLHQGLDQNYKPDGSQQIFLLRGKKQGPLTAVDQDDSVDGIQGVPISLTSPGKFLYKDSEQPLIATFCYVFSSTSCRFGFERFNLETLQVTKVAEFGDRYLYNGTVVEGGNPSVLYASLTDAGETSNRSVIRIAMDSALNTMEFAEVHRFPAAVSGCCELLFDSSTNQLAVASQHPDDLDRGQLTIYEGVKPPEKMPLLRTISLPGNPAAGLMLPKVPR